MLSSLEKFGNSSGVIIPKPLLSECGLIPGDDIRMTVAPMTSGSRPGSFRVPIEFQGVAGLVLIEQSRALDKRRLVKRLGRYPIRS